MLFTGCLWKDVPLWKDDCVFKKIEMWCDEQAKHPPYALQSGLLPGPQQVQARSPFRGSVSGRVSAYSAYSSLLGSSKRESFKRFLDNLVYVVWVGGNKENQKWYFLNKDSWDSRRKTEILGTVGPGACLERLLATSSFSGLMNETCHEITSLLLLTWK